MTANSSSREATARARTPASSSTTRTRGLPLVPRTGGAALVETTRDCSGAWRYEGLRRLGGGEHLADCAEQVAWGDGLVCVATLPGASRWRAPGVARCRYDAGHFGRKAE